jgi:hypothetical protein
MSKQNRTGLIVMAAVLGIVVAPSAMAAPKDFCKLYAKVAINQSNKANALQLGCFGFRWHNWYDGHYQWCRSASLDSARSEALVRHRALLGGQC